MFEDLFIFQASDQLNLYYDEPGNEYHDQMETVKIIDGLFVGNQHAARATEFLSNNKIGLIINCQPTEVNLSQKEVQVLKYNFQSQRGVVQENINHDEMINLLCEIQKTLLNNHEGVLIIAKNIDSRVLCLTGIYFMTLFHWPLSKWEQLLQRKKEKLEMSQKYRKILINLSNNQIIKNKINFALSDKQIEHQEQLIINTMVNAEMKNIPNFHGLSHLKQQSPSEHCFNPRTVKFIETVHYIQPSIRQSEESQDSSAKVEQNQSQKLKCSPPRKGHIRMLTVQQKLKKFIQEKCQLQPSDHQKEEKTINRKIFERVQKRKIINRSEEFIDGKTQKQRLNKMTDNFLNQVFIKKQVCHKNENFLMNSKMSDPFVRSRPKIHSACSSKTQIPKRCQTEGTNYSEMQKESHNKNSSLFKISKNKSSNKKIKTEIGQRPKIHSFKASQKHFRYNTQDHENVRNIGQYQSRKKGKNLVNLNVNIHIDNFNLFNDRNKHELGSSHLRKQRMFYPKKALKQFIYDG